MSLLSHGYCSFTYAMQFTTAAVNTPAVKKAGRALMLGGVLALCVGFGQAQAEEAPDFSLPGLVDITVDLAEHRGKVIYLDFWASWCVPCRESFPWMNELQNKHSKRSFEVIAINLDKDHQAAVNFLKKLGNQVTVAFDKNSATAEAYGVVGMPSSYVIDRQGNIAFSHIGFEDKHKELIEQKINGVLGVSP